MKKFLTAVLAVAFLFSMTGCSPAPNDTETDTPTPPTAPVSDALNTPNQQPMFAVALPVVTQEHTDEDGTVLLRSVYQNIELTVPDQEVADEIIIDFLNRIDPITSESDALLAQAKTEYTPGTDFASFLSQITFTPMRLDQGVLSLMGEYVKYQGSAHPEVTAFTCTYDLTNGMALSIKDILAGDNDGQVLQAVLDSLSQQKDALYEDYEITVETLLKDNENWYLSKTGLVYCFSPYEIGPYASGVITAEVPYEKLPGILKDAYFPAEKDTSSGNLEVMDFDINDVSSLTQIAEVICSENGHQAVLYTNGLLEDVRILSPEGNTIFAAATLSPGDGITLHGASADSYTISYHSGQEDVTRTLNFSSNGTPSLAS